MSGVQAHGFACLRATAAGGDRLLLR